MRHSLFLLFLKKNCQICLQAMERFIRVGVWDSSPLRSVIPNMIFLDLDRFHLCLGLKVYLWVPRE